MTEKESLIAALIITFNPDERLLLSLENVQRVTQHVVIVDNDSDHKSFVDRLKISFKEKIYSSTTSAQPWNCWSFKLRSRIYIRQFQLRIHINVRSGHNHCFI